METTNLTGHFIIAMPSLADPNFGRSVTYICEHDENGSFGIVINRQTDIPLQEIIEQMQIESPEVEPHKQHIYLGGPVQQSRGFVLHRPLGNWSSSLKINQDIALTTSRDIIEAIARNQGPEDAIIALGYAGWAPGQLEMEIAENSWLSCPANEQIMFDTPVQDRWQAAADLIGVDLGLLSQDAGHA
jgi:putative transcriptional regulator